MFLLLWMIIQVIAESLPISSSGHVALMQKSAIKFSLPVVVDPNLWAFDYLLQGISAIVIAIYFFIPWWQLIIGKPLHISTLTNFSVWKKIVTKVFAFGLVADTITFLLWYYDITSLIQLPLFIGFIITGITLWSMQYTQEKMGLDIWSLRSACIVGFIQGCALISGISRFATTFAALRWLGYKNNDAFSISFLIQWPLITAGAIKGCKVLLESGQLYTIVNISLITCMIPAGIVAYLLLCGMQKIVDKNNFWKFSYYMMIPTLLAYYLKDVV